MPTFTQYEFLTVTLRPSDAAASERQGHTRWAETSDLLTKFGMKGWKVAQVIATPIVTERKQAGDSAGETKTVGSLLYTIILEQSTTIVSGKTPKGSKS